MVESRFASLASAVIFEVYGPDAERYLNNRLAADIKKLAPQSGAVHAACLSAQGKCEGLFLVLRLDTNSFLLYADGGETEELSRALLRFKVADRVTCKLSNEVYSLIHVWPLDAAIKALDVKAFENGTYARNNNDELFIRRNRVGVIGADIITRTTSPLETRLKDYGCTNETESNLNFLRLKAKVPQFPNEVNNDTLLQESGLESCYSIEKGCYVGQEVIQKIVSVGKTPAKLMAFCLTGKVGEAAKLSEHADGGSISGSIISKAYDEVSNLTCGFARVKIGVVSGNLRPTFLGNTQLELYAPHDYTNDL